GPAVGESPPRERHALLATHRHRRGECANYLVARIDDVNVHAVGLVQEVERDARGVGAGGTASVRADDGGGGGRYGGEQRRRDLEMLRDEESTHGRDDERSRR